MALVRLRLPATVVGFVLLMVSCGRHERTSASDAAFDATRHDAGPPSGQVKVADVASREGSTETEDARVTTTDTWLSGTSCLCSGESHQLPEGQWVRVWPAGRFLAEEKLERTLSVEVNDSDVFLITGEAIRRRAVLDVMARDARTEARSLDAELAGLTRDASTGSSDRGQRAEVVRARARAAKERAKEALAASPSTLHAYLVRAMALTCAGGPTEVSLCDDHGIDVASGCMGRHPSPAIRAPVVVFLLSPPSRLCLQLRMTE